MMPCIQVKANQHFEETYRLHLQGQRETNMKQAASNAYFLIIIPLLPLLSFSLFSSTHFVRLLIFFPIPIFLSLCFFSQFSFYNFLPFLFFCLFSLTFHHFYVLFLYLVLLIFLPIFFFPVFLLSFSSFLFSFLSLSSHQFLI
jgi:hypothetical protein